MILVDVKLERRRAAAARSRERRELMGMTIDQITYYKWRRRGRLAAEGIAIRPRVIHRTGESFPVITSGSGFHWEGA